MKFKNSLLIICLLICLFAVASVSATDVNDTAIASEDDSQIELSTGDEVTENNLQANNEETVSAETDSEILTDGQYTYSNLREQIGSGGNINLTKGTYTYNNDGDTIEISTSGVINGNGAVIDMTGSTIRAFGVTGFGVTIKNLTIKNCNNGESGGAIRFFGSGTVENCNFISNTALYGGAISFSGNGTVTNCNFTNNSASRGGAIEFYYGTTGTAENCNFVNNSATIYGGAVNFYDSGNGTVTNCNFTNNSASSGGAIEFYYGTTGIAENCNFVNNSATIYGGAVNFYGSGNGTVTNCNFTNNKVTEDSRSGGAIYFERNGSVVNCNFADNKVAGVHSNGGAVYFDKEGNVTNCNFTNNKALKSGGAVYFTKNGAVTNCNFADNKATGSLNSNGGAVYFNDEGNVTNCNFTNNSADYGGAIWINSGNVTDCNFTDNSASVGGGSICMSSGSVENCNFTDNTASGDGGAVYFNDEGNMKNCYFFNNTASSGGAAYFTHKVNVANCNFIDNTASGDGGAVYFDDEGNVTNCNFTNNSASRGGAIEFYYGTTGTAENCNFVNNSATIYGGAVNFYGSGNGTVTNCNFTNNKVTEDSRSGGAIYFERNGSVVNCNFADNTASGDGGAVYFDKEGNVTNCNFTNNKAQKSGGAVYFTKNGAVTNCNFADNKATGSLNSNGGAVYFNDEGNVTNCNFTNNSADYGGAIWINSGNVTDCNFTDNRVTGDYGYGGAVYIGSGRVENCNFTDNRVTGDYGYGGAVYINANGNVANCNFTGNKAPAFNSKGGAVYMVSGSVKNCNFTDNSASASNSRGGAVYFLAESTVTNCNFIYNHAETGGAIDFEGIGTVESCNFTGNNAGTGSAIYFFSNSVTNTVYDSCFLNNRADAKSLDLINNEDSITIVLIGNDNLLNAIYSNGNVSFTNVTYWGANGIANTGTSPITPSRSTNEQGQNITIEVYDSGDFLVDNVTLVTDDNGQVIYDFLKLGNGNYTYKAYHPENTYYTYTEKEGMFISGDFNRLQRYINRAKANSELILYQDYTFTIGVDEDLVDGIVIDKPITINGNGHTIDANGKARIFQITHDKVVLINITFINANAADDGGAIYFTGSGNIINCNFTNNTASSGGAVYFYNEGNVTNCKFTGNNAGTGSAVYFSDDYATNTVHDSCFLNNRADVEELEVTKNENNFTITFTGNDNLLNAIYSNGNVSFTNVTYWGANGIANTGNSSITPSKSNKEAGQNITVVGIINGNIIDTVKVTDSDGKIVLENVVGDYLLVFIHDADSYYSQAETASTNMKLYINVTSQTTHNRTVNVTAKSNIPTEVIKGILLFLIPNSDPVVANYAGNGTWWTVYTFDAFTDYRINALYDRLDNVTINNATITITRANSTISLDNVVLNYGDSIKVNVTTEGALGIKAMIDGTDVGVINYAIPISGLDAGSYALTVTTIPDGDHNPVSKTVNITVNKVETQLTASPVTATYGINKNLVITLKDANGKALSGFKVTFNLNGAKTYFTDKNGQVKINVANLVPKAYTAKVTFAGDNNYKPSSANVKVTVKKAKSKIIAKKKTFKKAQKVKKYTITLKDNIGKPIKKSKVTLKIKGKTFKAKTNAKGKATFKIKKLTKKGTFKAKITFKGNAYYNKVTKKVKIKMK